MTNIGAKAFERCSGLTSITIPDSVTVIGESAFWGCSGLTIITIPDGVTIVDSCAFDWCSGLTSITIPVSVTDIYFQAFNGCVGLKTINYNGTKKEWELISKNEWWNNETGNYTVTCSDGMLDKNGNEIE